MITTGRRATSAYLLELGAAGELPEAEARRVLADARHACPGADPAAALAADAAATLSRHPPRRVAAEVARRDLAAGRAHRPGALVPLVAASCAAALAVAIALPGRPQPAGSDGEGAPADVRVKGTGAHLVVHRRVAAGAERVAPGTPVRPGDLVQLGYVAGGRPYGAIVSVDGAGAVTRHWPLDGTLAATLEPAHEVLLPESFRLDAAPGFERFFLVTSGVRFDLSQVIEAARTLAARADARDAPLPLPSGVSASDLVLPKELR